MKKYEWAIFLHTPIPSRWNGNYWVGQSIILVFTEKELNTQLETGFVSGKDRFGMTYKIPKLNISCIKLAGLSI